MAFMFDSEQFLARIAEHRRQAEIDLQAQIAALSPGQCVICFGRKRVEDWRRDDWGRRCPECDPPDTWASGVPFEFRAARFKNYDVLDGNSTALDKARTFVDQPGRDLYMCGPVGGGKSRLACTIANELFDRRKGCLFARVPMVLHQLQPGRDDDGEYEGRLFTVPFLVLDDIGAERDQATDFTRRTLLMIYEERGDRGLRTIFTSNKSVQQLAEMQDDDRLASRIAGRADVVKLSTPDQRMKRRGRS